MCSQFGRFKIRQSFTFAHSRSAIPFLIQIHVDDSVHRVIRMKSEICCAYETRIKIMCRFSLTQTRIKHVGIQVPREQTIATTYTPSNHRMWLKVHKAQRNQKETLFGIHLADRFNMMLFYFGIVGTERRAHRPDFVGNHSMPLNGVWHLCYNFNKIAATHRNSGARAQCIDDEKKKKTGNEKPKRELNNKHRTAATAAVDALCVRFAFVFFLYPSFPAYNFEALSGKICFVRKMYKIINSHRHALFNIVFLLIYYCVAMLEREQIEHWKVCPNSFLFVVHFIISMMWPLFGNNLLRSSQADAFSPRSTPLF